MVSCGDNSVKPENSNTEKSLDSGSRTCDDFWAVYIPSDTVKIQLLEEILEKEKSLSNENAKLLKAIVTDLKHARSLDSLPLIFEHPLFPIHRLGKDQIGVLGYSNPQEVDGQWEDFSKEDQLLKKDFGYQSIDSVGKLVFFPKTYDKLYPLTKPSIYWYSMKKKGKSSLSAMGYMGDECLSYFQYSMNLSSDEEKEDIIFGSPYSLDLEFVSKPEIDKKFSSQMVKNCLDCPTNYSDQKVFAKLIGTNIYFTQADSWPINNKLKAPSRSMVLLKSDGSVVTIWNSELDLFGCGCL
jgi:hypothetical protein|tara:strand:+ start:56981 stop:57868 length:888 start_codon:yes stop_codon:yes gene_type:complete